MQNRMENDDMSNYINITDCDGNVYLMYVREYERFDMRGVLLCFKSEEDKLTNVVPPLFDTLEFDTRFGMLVNRSVYCSIEYIDKILLYIDEHRDQIRDLLRNVLSDAEIHNFFAQLRPNMLCHNIQGSKQFSVEDCADVANLAHGTARKRFFVYNEYGNCCEVSLSTAMAIYGREAIIDKCQALNYLNGVGINGRAIWLDGIGIQDVDRDGLCGGWCR